MVDNKSTILSILQTYKETFVYAYISLQKVNTQLLFILELFLCKDC